MSPAHPTHPAPARAGRHCVGRLGRSRPRRARRVPRRRRCRASAGLPCVPSGARARAAAAVARDCRLARSPTPESLVSASHSRQVPGAAGRSGPSLRHRDRQVTAHTRHKLSNTQGVPPIGRVACSVINLSLSSLTLTRCQPTRTDPYDTTRHTSDLTHTSHTPHTQVDTAIWGEGRGGAAPSPASATAHAHPPPPPRVL